MSSSLPVKQPSSGSVERRWLALSVIALAQLMAALDSTIVSIALPSAQRALGATEADRQWVITAYTLAFGGLLPAGGRIADTIGRKRAFLLGLAGFAIASAIGGTAANFGILLVARSAQGAFAALLTPTALSLLAITFTEPHERARAFALYGAIAGSGAAIGLLLGGVLTQYLDWRWCLYVNVPIAIGAAIGGWRLLGPDQPRMRRRFDIPGVLLVTGGLASLVYACSQAVALGWRSTTVIGLMFASLLLLVAFAIRELRASAPLLPLGIVLDRNRGGAFLAAALAIAGMFGAFLFLTYYLQVVLRYTPLLAGLAFLPMAVGSQAGSWGIASVLMPRVAARWIMAPGALVAAAGMLVLTQIGVHSSYFSHVLPAELLLGIGISCVMAPAFNVGTFGVNRQDAGVAAATVNASTQVGASLGTALLNTVAAATSGSYLAGRQVSGAIVRQALVQGYAAASWWAAVILALCSLTVLVFIRAGGVARH
jgi:EmrB/QacA subfamily drug resistance transporter